MEKATTMKVLFLAAEVAPFAKAGGLADVTGALPKALAERGMDVRVVMPKYNKIDVHAHHIEATPLRYAIPFDEGSHLVRVFRGSLPGSTVPVYFLDHPHYEGAGDIYYQDVTNAAEQHVLQVERFLFFCAAALRLLPELGWQPDILHAHDWHAALAPWLAHSKGADAHLRSMASVYTIHNLALQGGVGAARFRELIAPIVDDGSLGTKAGGTVNITKVGLRAVDMITTVSPSYAREILQPEFGCGLDGVLRERRQRLVGILNGIDTSTFDPAHDALIQRRYSANRLGDKTTNTLALKKALGITNPGPVFGFISRLTEQKGVELICTIIPELVHLGCGVVVLGAGEPALEARMTAQARRFPNAVSARIGFDVHLAQRIYAGSDFFLMPSKYEPCGLGQMIAMRYGTIPIVRAVGGLRDTVQESPHGNGFVFEEYSAAALAAACHRALDAFHNGAEWSALQRRAMRQDFSWNTSAAAYEHVYALAQHHHAEKRAS